MYTGKKPNRNLAWHVLGLFAVSAICIAGDKKDDPPGDIQQAAEKPVLKIAVATHTKDVTKLEFILENKSKAKLVTTEICTTRNRIVVTKPDGKKREIYVWENPLQQVVVEAGQMRKWEIDLRKQFGMPEMTERGPWEIRWVISDLSLSSEPLFLLGSGDGPK